MKRQMRKKELRYESKCAARLADKEYFHLCHPLMLSSILQNFFNVADKAVLGHMAGEVAVASIAATSTIAALVINGAVGLASGTSIVLARFIGQGDQQKIRATIMLYYIVAWLLNLSFYVIAFAFVYRRYVKTGICKKI